MTIQALKRKKQELLASQVSNLVSDTNENLLRVNLSKFFTDLEAEIQSALMEYWNDTMLLQGQVNLILAPIHEKHQEYYELIMKHKLQEFHRAEQQGKRLVKRQEQSAMKASKPVKMTATRNNLFGTLKYSEDKLANDTFKASQNTLNRVDDNINQILTDGYKSGVGINEVSRQITERFDQLRTWEATRIARTEIHTAQNMGVMNSYDQLGVEYTQWIAASDDRVRDSHIDIDGEIIPIGSTYSNGLSFPGDTSGPIEEWINCRCSNAPFVLPAGMMAPPYSPFREDDLVDISAEVPEVTEPTPIEQPQISDDLLKEKLTDKEYKQYNGWNNQIEESKTWLKNHPEATEKQRTAINNEIEMKLDKIKKLEEKALGIEKQVSESVQINANAPSPVSPLEGYSMDTLKKDIPIEDKTFDKMMNWSYKRATKNKIEYGYQFDTSTGKLIGDEVKGKKGSVTFKQHGENIGSMHTHPPERDSVGGGAFPSKEDLKLYRGQDGADHLIGSPNEVWYVHAEEKLGISPFSVNFGQKEIDKVYSKVYDEVSAKGQQLVKQGKLKTDNESLRTFMNKEIGDGLLREFNTPEWQEKGFYLRRAYR